MPELKCVHIDVHRMIHICSHFLSFIHSLIPSFIQSFINSCRHSFIADDTDGSNDPHDGDDEEKSQGYSLIPNNFSGCQCHPHFQKLYISPLPAIFETLHTGNSSKSTDISRCVCVSSGGIDSSNPSMFSLFELVDWSGNMVTWYHRLGCFSGQKPWLRIYTSQKCVVKKTHELYRFASKFYIYKYLLEENNDINKLLFSSPGIECKQNENRWK